MKRLTVVLCCVLSSHATARAVLATANRPTRSHDVDGQTTKRVLMLISDTGGGHRASANALQAMMSELRPKGVDVKIVDIWTEHGAWPDNQMPRTYPFFCRHPQLWRAMFYTSPLLEKPWFAATRLTCGPGFKRCISEYDPDLVVSLHPLCQHLPLHLTRRLGAGGVPFATVCTDLGGAHPAWFVKGVDACFVPSDAVRRIAEHRGVASSKIRQYGLPVRKEFWRASARSQPSARKRSKLGLAPHKRTVLVVGGGDGVGNLEAIVDATAAELAGLAPSAQLVALCGRNAAARRRLEERQCAGRWPEVTVHVRGFTSEMSSYMEAADCLVTKAGPGTIAEAALRGLPTILSSFLPGQEFGNVAFVVERGFGQFARQPKAIGRTVSAWLRDDAKREELGNAARAAATPLATRQIATDLLCMMDGEKGWSTK